LYTKGPKNSGTRKYINVLVYERRTAKAKPAQIIDPNRCRTERPTRFCLAAALEHTINRRDAKEKPMLAKRNIFFHVI